MIADVLRDFRLGNFLFFYWCFQVDLFASVLDVSGARDAEEAASLEASDTNVLHIRLSVLMINCRRLYLLFPRRYPCQLRRGVLAILVVSYNCFAQVFVVFCEAFRVGFEIWSPITLHFAAGLPLVDYAIELVFEFVEAKGGEYWLGWGW